MQFHEPPFLFQAPLPLPALLAAAILFSAWQPILPLLFLITLSGESMGFILQNMRKWVSFLLWLALLPARGNIVFLWEQYGCDERPLPFLILHFNFNYIIKAVASHLRGAGGQDLDG